MPLAPAASDLERRKRVRLRLRSDLSVTPQKYEGKTYYVVKDPVSLRYYRFKEQEHFLLNLMDGKHTLDQAQKDFENRFRPERLTLEDLEQFGQQLLQAGLVQNETPGAGKLLFEHRRKRRRMEMLGTFTNILYIKIPIFDPEKVLNLMLPWLWWMFTLWFLFASVVFLGSAIALVPTYVELMIAALATFVWWNTPGGTFVNNLSLSLMIVCSVSTVLFNGNPLMRYDGYYVLADWMEIPNLRDRANRYLQNLAMEYCLGIEVQPEPYMQMGRKVLFLVFAIISYVYRWVIT